MPLIFLALIVALVPGPLRAPAPSFHACTFNLWRELPARTLRREVAELAPDCALMGLQEARVLGVPAGWAAVRATRAPSQPILYRTDTWAREASGAVLGHRSDLFRSATRWLVWARLRYRPTGQRLTVVDVHAIPHVEYRGHPRPLPRLALYRRWMIRLGELVDRTRGPVLVLGDFNVAHGPDCRVGWYWFPCRWAPRHRLVNVWDALGGGRGTHGRRTIDYALDRGRKISPVSRHVLFGFPSDHRPVVVRYSLSR
jgi:endonuclease/exonuclease/phosphatase (EEP) superfamily protein YafD